MRTEATATMLPAAGGSGDRRRRVLHLLPDLAIGGGQTIVLQHLRHGDRARFHVEVAHLGPVADMREAFVDAGVVPVALGHERGRTAATVARLVRLLREDRIDLLHVHSDIDRKYGQFAALVTGVPVVGHLHSLWVHLGPKLPPNPSAARRAWAQVMGGGRDVLERRTVRHYVAESNDVKELFTPLVAPPIAVLQQSVPLEAFEAAEARAGGADRRQELGGGPVLLNVSRLVPGKGQGHLVAMMAQLRDRWPTATLVLVGDGDQRAAVERLAAQGGVGDRIRFLGNRLDVPDLLALADVFVFASETEGFGLAVLEAMAAARPVAAFRLPALEEFAEDGRTALLVDLGDVAALAGAVDTLLAQPERARSMGLAGRAVVAERFPAAGVARTFEAVYDTVLTPQPPVGGNGPTHTTRETT